MSNSCSIFKRSWLYLIVGTGTSASRSETMVIRTKSDAGCWKSNAEHRTLRDEADAAKLDIRLKVGVGQS